MEIDTTDPHKTESEDAVILKEALRCYKQGTEAWADQRKRETDDLRFQVPDMQWDEDAKAQRRGTRVGGVDIAARPMLSIPQLDQPIQLVDNQERSAHLGINVHPISEDADDDTAEVIQGIYRSIERDSQAAQARSWAFQRADRAGFGWYRINTVWDEEGGHEFDQKIVIERILHQESVVIDPAATRADFADAEWAFVTAWVPLPTFRRLYPDAESASYDDTTFGQMYSATPDWIRGEGDSRAVLVVEYFRKVHTREVVVLLPNGQVVPKAVAPAGLELPERERDVVSVMVYTHTASEVLAKQKWNGKHIPLIPVPGRELQPFNGERYWFGMIRPARDGQKFYNYSATNLTEYMAMEPRAPFTGDAEQFEGYEDFWAQANIRNFPYLPHKAVVRNGQLLPPPQRTQVTSSGMSISLMALQEAHTFIQSATATFDPALGNLSAKERSGKAILALQGQSDAGTSHFLQNLSQVSMPWEAVVILDLMPAVYDRAGRVARTLDEEDNIGTVMLGVPFVMDGKRPRAVPMAGQDGRQAGLPRGAKHYDLRKGRYGVSVTVGKSYQTRLQQGADEIGQVLSAAPELMMVMGDLYFRHRDFPGAKPIAERLKKLIAQKNPGMMDEEGEPPDPQRLQAMLQQMEQENQQLKSGLARLSQEITTEQTKQQAGLKKAEMDAQASLQKSEMDNAAKQQVAEIAAQAKLVAEQIQAAADMALQRVKQEFEAMEAERQRKHEEEMAEYQARAARLNAEGAADREDARTKEDSE